MQISFYFVVNASDNLVVSIQSIGLFITCRLYLLKTPKHILQYLRNKFKFVSVPSAFLSQQVFPAVSSSYFSFALASVGYPLAISYLDTEYSYIKIPAKRQMIIPRNFGTPHMFNFFYNVVLQIEDRTKPPCYNSATFSPSVRVVVVGIDGVPIKQLTLSIEFFHCNLVSIYILVTTLLFSTTLCSARSL